MFSTEALEKGIEDIKKNIKIFEDTIEKEKKRILEYYDMIEQLKQQKIATQNAHIKVMKDDNKNGR